MKKFLTYLAIILELGVIVSLIKGMRVTLTSSERLKVLEEERAKLVAEKTELEARYAYLKSQNYLDQVARNELHLAKEGETIVIVPEEAVPADTKQQLTVSREKKNWEKWREVILGW